MVTVDVRDMMCAQALALIAQALARLANGQSLEVVYNAHDVRRDVLAWARDAGHCIQEQTPSTITLQRGTL